MFSENVTLFLDFLTSLYNDGLFYSAINTARSAVSSIVICNSRGQTLGAHPLVSKFMKGIFVLRAPSVRYKSIWDVEIVLKWLVKLSPVQRLSLRNLTLKTVMLIALTSACRGDTLFKLDISDMREGKSSFNFHVLMKQSRRGYTTPVINLKAYPCDRRLCVYTVLKHYLSRTSSLRGHETRLFLSYLKPHKTVTKCTISRWIKTVLNLSGVDTSVFKPHSTRAASTSKALLHGVPLDNILDTAGWTQSSTFATYYQKEIVPVEPSVFAAGVLKR